LRELWEKLPSLSKKTREGDPFQGSFNSQLLYSPFVGTEQNFTIRINYENAGQNLWNSGQDSEESEEEEEEEHIQTKTEEETKIKIEQNMDCKIEPRENISQTQPSEDQTSTLITKKEESYGEYF